MYGVVSLEARKLLIEQNLPSTEERRGKLCASLENILKCSTQVGYLQRAEIMTSFLESNVPIRDLLPTFFRNGTTDMQLAALELYIRMVYITHQLSSVCVCLCVCAPRCVRACAHGRAHVWAHV